MDMRDTEWPNDATCASAGAVNTAARRTTPTLAVNEPRPRRESRLLIVLRTFAPARDAGPSGLAGECATGGRVRRWVATLDASR